MPTPFRVHDGDDPGTDLGGWNEDGSIDIPGGMSIGGDLEVEGDITGNVQLPAAGSFTTLTVGGLNVPGQIDVPKTANETVTNSNVLQNDNELLAAVDANSTYKMDLRIFTNGPVGAVNTNFGWTAPALATMQWGDLFGDAATTIAGTQNRDVIGTGASDLRLFEAVGTLITGANAGTLQLQWAQGTADPTASTVFAGSVLTLIKIA